MAGNDGDKWKGRGKQATGKVRETAGRVSGDEEMEARGKTEQGKGKLQETFGKFKERLLGR